MAEVSTAQLAALFDCSGGTIAELARKGIVVRTARGRFDAPASIRRYVAHLREIAAGRGGEQGVLDLTAERARLAKEQADGHAFKNALARDELLEADAVKREWSSLMRDVRAGLLAVSGRVRQRLGHLTVNDVSEIDLEIRAALKETGHDGGAG